MIQLTERRGEAERRIDRAVREIEGANVRLAGIKERIEGAESECGAVAEKIESGEGVVLELDGRFKKMLESMERLKTRLVDHKQTQLDFLQNQVNSLQFPD